MFTENYTEETTKIYEMTKVIFTEVIYHGNEIERNRIDFPKQIRIKRKYLLVVRRKSSE